MFCGWLCPFGALQELINEAARKLKIRQYELPFALHERLWAIKYIILLALFGGRGATGKGSRPQRAEKVAAASQTSAATG